MRDSFRRCYLLPFCQGTRTPLDLEDQTALYVVQRSLKPLPSSETIYHFVTAMMRFGDETPKGPWLPWLRLVSLSAESQRGVLVTVSLYKLPASDWHRILKCLVPFTGTWHRRPRRHISSGHLYRTSRWVSCLDKTCFQHLSTWQSMQVDVDECRRPQLTRTDRPSAVVLGRRGCRCCLCSSTSSSCKELRTVLTERSQRVTNQ